MTDPADPHNLSRFVEAQADDYEQALVEIGSGRKRSHWMWYIFPQYDGLGSSATLFTCVSPPGSVFERLLDKYFQGERDDRTVHLLAK